MFGPDRLVFALLVPLCSFCASLSGPDQVAAPGQTIITPLSFSAVGKTVSGVQFDVDWDPSLTVRLFAGAQVGASAKSFYTVSLNGALRVVIAGINQQAIADGEMARLMFSVDPNAPPSTAEIRIRNALATDPDSNPVSIPLARISVQIQGSSALQPARPAAIVNAASLLPGPLSPGEVVTVLGGANLQNTSSVVFNGAQAPVLYAGSGQVNTIVPFGVDPTAAATIELRGDAGTLAADTYPMAAFTPAVFTQASSGVGQGVILNQDYTVNSIFNPASPGSVVVLYATGFGLPTTPVPDGVAINDAIPIAGMVTATIAGSPADVLYAGTAPGLIAGVMQINVRVPASTPPTGEAPISLQINSVSTAPGVTVSIGK